MNEPASERTVAVITRTKNRPILLKRALRSVIEQSYQDWLLVIVNDGGAPEPVDRLVNHFAKQAQGRIQVIHNPQSVGMEAASNIGIRALAGKFGYLVIHDDDDSWAPDFLTIAVGELELARSQHPSIQGVITMAHAVFERIGETEAIVDFVEEYRPWLNGGLISLGAVLTENLFAPIQFLYSGKVIEEIGLYRETLPVLGDWEFNVRFLQRYDIMIVPQVLAFYHHRLKDGQSIYVNSIFASKERHEFYRQLLKNEWLRDDLRSGAASLGALGHLLPHINQRYDEISSRFAKLETRISSAETSPHRTSVVALWARSGRAFHYLKQFILSLVRRGPSATLATVREWVATRGLRGQ